jgi:hypothetical protein
MCCVWFWQVINMMFRALLFRGREKQKPKDWNSPKHYRNPYSNGARLPYCAWSLVSIVLLVSMPSRDILPGQNYAMHFLKKMPCSMHLITLCVTSSTRAKGFRMLQPCRSRAGPDETTGHTTSKSFSQLRPVKPAEPDGRIDRFTHAFKPSWSINQQLLRPNNASALHALP